jgi:hypothetical protein
VAEEKSTKKNKTKEYEESKSQILQYGSDSSTTEHVVVIEVLSSSNAYSYRIQNGKETLEEDQ